jgi:hypothetical protein
MKKPLIILFGWLGAKEKHLSKYSHFYKENNFQTMSYISPLHTM